MRKGSSIFILLIAWAAILNASYTSEKHLADQTGIRFPNHDKRLLFNPPVHPPTSTSSILVKFRAGVVRAIAMSELEQRHGLREKRRFKLLNMAVMQVADPARRDEVLKQLSRRPDVEYAQADLEYRILNSPNDPEFAKLWGLHNTGQTGGTADADIDAPEAWGISSGSSNVVVAVIDTGVAYTHPDLAANMWRNPGETPGDNLDNDSDGYTDDVYGINAITGEGDPMDDHFHGTHCSGTIGAVGNNGIGVAGVCWNVKIMALKFLNAGGSGYTSDAVTCIEYAIAHGANAISASWGGGIFDPALYDAIAAAKNAGILFVAAAGNSAMDNDQASNYPSGYDLDNIIAVAATDANDRLANFSCYGAATVDVAAPGVDIYSTVPGNGYATHSGTSMAAPHVSGLAALLKAHEPTLAWSQIKARILGTVDPLESLAGKVLTSGRINANWALSANYSPAVEITSPTQNSIVSGTVPIIVSASDGNGIQEIGIYIDGVLKKTFTSPPYQYNWDTTASANTMHTLKAVASDKGGRTASNQISVKVNNTGLPGVFIVQPLNGASVAGLVTIEATTAYAPGIASCAFWLDGVKQAEDTAAPYEFAWDTSGSPNGSHTITVQAIGNDAAAGSDSVSVSLFNSHLPAVERNALIAIYNTSGGDRWTDRANWKKADGSFNDPGTEHTWKGVVIEDDHVTQLLLFDNNLTGELTPAVAAFSELQWLILWGNRLSGSIPPELGLLSKLVRLDLGWGNYFSGAIPPELGNLTNLENLTLDFLNLSGPLPPELGNCTKLKEIEVDRNYNLSGAIPSTFANLVNMENFCIGANQFSGSIPAFIGSMTKLRWLFLGECRFTGTIPPELGNLSELYELDLYENLLTGDIPPELGQLTKLYQLRLEGNQLSGGIPRELGSLTALGYLYLFDNQLTGTIPAELGNLVNLYQLKLDQNKLYGEIPPALLNLKKIQVNSWAGLGVSYNALYSTNAEMIAFLNQFDHPDYPWDAGQTIAPNSVQATALSPSSIRISWTPIPYSDDSGGYRIYCATMPGGPYTLAGTVADKKASSFDVDNLTPGILHYFRVQTYTDPRPGSYTSHFFDHNQNTVESEYSSEVAYGSIPASLAVTSPNGGESWVIGSSRSVTWTATGYTGLVRLVLYNGGTKVGAIATGLSAGAGTYTWVVGQHSSGTAPAGANYKVRIVSNDGTLSDWSDAAFAITAVPSLTVTSPNGGESWTVGSSRAVTWTATAYTGLVRLVLYNGNTKVGAIATGLSASAGTYSWTVGQHSGGTAPAGANYKARIVSNDGTLSDWSDAAFAITAVPSLTVTSPNGGESWTIGSSHAVTWTATGYAGLVRLVLYDGNAKVGAIATGVSAGAGTYGWTVGYYSGGTSPAGANYRVRVVSNDGTLSDWSDAAFTIADGPALVANHASTNSDTVSSSRLAKVGGKQRLLLYGAGESDEAGLGLRLLDSMEGRNQLTVNQAPMVGRLAFWQEKPSVSEERFNISEWRWELEQIILDRGATVALIRPDETAMRRGLLSAEAYIAVMGELSERLPGVILVYSTASMPVREETVEAFNHLVREHALKAGKVLFDTAELESWYGGEREVVEEMPVRHRAYAGFDPQTAEINLRQQGQTMRWLLAKLSGWIGSEGSIIE